MGNVVEIYPYRKRRLQVMPASQELVELSILKLQVVTLRNALKMMGSYTDREAAAIRIGKLNQIIYRREDKIIKGI